MIRGIEGKSIFRDNRDRKEFVTRLGKLTKETGTRVLAWSLLRNQVHLLLFSGASGLALFMRRLLPGCAQGFESASFPLRYISNFLLDKSIRLI
jgi:putative transposase